MHVLRYWAVRLTQESEVAQFNSNHVSVIKDGGHSGAVGDEIYP